MLKIVLGFLALSLAATIAVAQEIPNGYTIGGGWSGGYYGGYYGSGYGYPLVDPLLAIGALSNEPVVQGLGIVGSVITQSKRSRDFRKSQEALAGALALPYVGPEAQARADRIRLLAVDERRISGAAADRVRAGARLTYSSDVSGDGSRRNMEVEGGTAVPPAQEAERPQSASSEARGATLRDRLESRRRDICQCVAGGGRPHWRTSRCNQ